MKKDVVSSAEITSFKLVNLISKHPCFNSAVRKLFKFIYVYQNMQLQHRGRERKREHLRC
jgi:hypothetical protein